jgi:hypothetical protein
MADYRTADARVETRVALRVEMLLQIFTDIIYSSGISGAVFWQAGANFYTWGEAR